MGSRLQVLHHEVKATSVPLVPYLAPGRIGTLEIRNRLVRAATSETMATDRGEVTDQLIRLYRSSPMAEQASS